MVVSNDVITKGDHMSKSITITLSDEMLATIASIRSTRLDRTENDIIQLIIERGCYALEYRTKYNKVKYARAKEEMAEFRAFKASQK
jgi:hypothetical protein